MEMTLEDRLADNRRRAQEAQQNAAFDALPEEIKNWVARIEAEAGAAVIEAREQRDRAIAEAERDAEPLKKQLAELEAELKASRAYLAAIPGDATPDEVGRHYIVDQHWKGRIQGVRNQLAENDRRVADAQAAYSREIEPLRVSIAAQFADVEKHLRALVVNPYRL